MGEKEWYFFTIRDSKYPTGLRTNRATKSGYWKTTGKDKEIFRVSVLVGMKKTCSKGWEKQLGYARIQARKQATLYTFKGNYYLHATVRLIMLSLIATHPYFLSKICQDTKPVRHTNNCYLDILLSENVCSTVRPP